MLSPNIYITEINFNKVELSATTRGNDYATSVSKFVTVAEKILIILRRAAWSLEKRERLGGGSSREQTGPEYGRAKERETLPRREGSLKIPQNGGGLLSRMFGQSIRKYQRRIIKIVRRLFVHGKKEVEKVLP